MGDRGSSLVNWNERIPGVGGTSANPGSYDALSPTPYKPPTDPSVPPQITAPPPRVSEEGMAPPRSPGALGKGASGKIGGIAFAADSILRGVMRGRQQAEQAKAYKLDKLSKGLQFAYQGAAQKYIELIKSGADPKSKEVVEAQMAADAAWQSMMGLYGNYIFGDEKKSKKGKGKTGAGGGGAGGMGGEQPDIGGMLASQDPNDKIKGWFMISQKAGAPYKYQAAQYQTPEYQKERELARGSQRMEGDIQEKRLKLHELQKIEPDKMTEQQRGDLERLQSDQELFPQAGRTIPHYGTTDVPGSKLVDAKDAYGNPQRDKFGNPIDSKQNYRIETIGGQQSYVPSIARSSTKPVRAWKKDDKGKFVSVLLDPNTNQIQPGTENYEIAPPPGLTDTIRTGEFSWVDIDGQLHRSKTSTTTTHSPAGGGGGGAAASGAGAGTGAGGHAAQSATGAPAAAAPHTPGDRIVGDTGKGQGARSIRKQAEKLQPLANLLAVQTQYMEDIRKDPSKANPRSDLALVIAAVRAMNPGSVRLPNKELELELKAGSYGQRFARWASVATEGTIPNDQREQLFKIVHDETTMAGENLAKDWRHNIPNEQLPAHLQQFDKGGGSGGAGAGANAPHKVDSILDEIMPKK